MWQRLAPDDPRRTGQLVARALTGTAVVLFWLVATGARPWRLFHRAGFSADFYDEQARAFLHGRLHVDPAVAGIEGFVVDDRTYLYFGPALAVARLPTALADRLAAGPWSGGPWSGGQWSDGRLFDGRLALASMLVALVVLATWSYRLLDVAGRLVGSGRPAGPWRTAAFVGAVLGSPVLFLAGWVSVYHETELWACTAAVVAATCLLEVLAGAPGLRWWVGAAAATAATVLTRASVGIGVALAAVAVAVAVRGGRRSVALAGSAMAAVVAHMSLNVVKFGSLLGLPAERQVLTLQDPDRAAWFAGNDGSFFSVRFLPTTLLHYLRPDTVRFDRVLPGVRFGPPAADVGGYPMETITPAASLTVAAPVLFGLAIVGLVALVRARRWPAVALVAGLAIGAAPSFLIGFLANRYLVDVLPLLVVPAACGLVVAGDRLRPGSRPGRGRIAPAVRVVVVVAVAWGLWLNASLGAWALGLKSPGFHEVRYRLDALVFPPPRPGLVGPEELDGSEGLNGFSRAGFPRDGVVAVASGCAGVYVAEQGRWVALERAEGRRVLTGRVAAVPGTLVDAGAWSIDVVPSDGTTTAVLRVGDDVVAGLPAGRLRVGDEVRVVADPVTGELSLAGDDTLVLFDPSIPGSDDVLVPVDLERDRAPAPPRLCEVLDGRR